MLVGLVGRGAAVLHGGLRGVDRPPSRPPHPPHGMQSPPLPRNRLPQCAAFEPRPPTPTRNAHTQLTARRQRIDKAAMSRVVSVRCYWTGLLLPHTAIIAGLVFGFGSNAPPCDGPIWLLYLLTLFSCFPMFSSASVVSVVAGRRCPRCEQHGGRRRRPEGLWRCGDHIRC